MRNCAFLAQQWTRHYLTEGKSHLMATDLPHSLVQIHDLKEEDLILAYRDPGDYSANEPELGGAIRLLHQSRLGVWDVDYRVQPEGYLTSGPMDLNDFDTLCYVSRSADLFIGKKNQ